jgi:GNAT superfamily N-acetyltransferase
MADDDGARAVISRLSEGDWRAWREIRLAALTEAPGSFADTAAEAEALGEPDWRAMTRDGAIFIATVGTRAVGVVAGLPRACALERGLGAMWVAPAWRGRGVAAMLAAAVIGWARSQDCTRVSLWVLADDGRAQAFYRRQGFRPTGQARPFPGAPGRSIAEMRLCLPAAP